MSGTTIAAIATVTCALIAAAGSVAVAFFTNRTGKAVDGRMTEMLELTRKASHAEGVKEEKDAQQGKQ